MKFSQHPVSDRTKLLLVGDSGAGKTAALGTLANAGYNLRILDFDDGLDILASVLDSASVDRVVFETLKDAPDGVGQSALATALDLIYKGWKTKSEDLGHITSWSSDDVLAIDSLTFMSEAAKRVALKANGKKPTDQLSQADWGVAQRFMENTLMYVMSDKVKANVVVTSHLQFIEEDGQPTKAYPASCGRGLSTKIGRYFNNVWRLDVKRDGKRVLRTVSDFRMDLKNTAPNVVLPEEEPDLAKVFEKIQGNAKHFRKAA